MKETIFEPLISPIFSATALSLLVCLAAGIATVYFIKTKKIGKHYRNIFSMLSFFASMMALGSVFFSWLQGERIGSVAIGQEHLETAYGDLDYKNIKEVLIKKEAINSSMLAPSVGAVTTNSMVIISKENQYYYFSEENYPVLEMIEPIRAAWKNANKKGSSD